MYIEEDVYNNIVNSTSENPPETGGILGGKKGVVTFVEYDAGIQTEKMCSYSPDTRRLNEVIKCWQREGVEFCGIFHTHYFGVETLSSGDKTYIKNIMNSMPETITKLYFPLVVMPQREMIAYAAVKKKEQWNIYREEIFLGGLNDEKQRI